MIRLFRKIRHRLLSEDKYPIYILYAAGEILLVVVGILLALQIDNWNDKRIEQKKIQTNLGNLIEALEEDVERLDAVQAVNTFRYKSLSYIIRKAGYKPLINDPSPLKIDSSFIWSRTDLPDTLDLELVGLGFNWSFRNNPFSNNYIAIDELKSTGMFSSIRKPLKESINNYYVRSGWIYSEAWEALDINRTSEFAKYIRDEFGVLLQDPSTAGLLLGKLQSDRQFALRLNEIALTALGRSNRASQMKDMAVSLIDELENELSDTGIIE